MTIEELYTAFCKHPSVCTDTRKIKKGDIFFALNGPNFKGSEFVEVALQAGASFCVTDASKIQNERVVIVNDTLLTLQQLAKYHRKQFTIPFIAITGSNGKTTTKELVHSVLSTSFITYTTSGNLNNHIGVPLTLLSIKKDAQMAIIEMGANHQQEIAGYCAYAMPTCGIITNCGKAHLEGFGGEEGVKKGKGELFDYIRTHNGKVFLNTDLPYLQELSKGISDVVTYGTSNAQHIGVVKENAGYLSAQLENGTIINTQLVGDYNLSNILAAVAVGRTFGVTENKIKKAIEAYCPSNSRSQLIEKNGNKIILDAYNANPSSMKVAIENFASMHGTGKILILGAMKEMGESSNDEHDNLVKLIQQYQWEDVVLVGKEFQHVPENFLHFETTEQAKAWFKSQQMVGKMILLKGSRGVALEKVLSD